MGWSLSWAAVRGGTREMACTSLRLRAVGRREEVPESNIEGVQLPTGWYLVLYNRNELADSELARFSRWGEVVSCFVEDHVMFSRASGWQQGKRIWSVTHDCEKGRFHLEVDGNPPAEHKDVAKRLLAEQRAAGGEQADVDYVYDIPAELAKAVTGFRHDQDMPGLSGEAFEILEPVKPTGRRGLLAALFARLFEKRGT